MTPPNKLPDKTGPWYWKQTENSPTEIVNIEHSIKQYGGRLIVFRWGSKIVDFVSNFGGIWLVPVPSPEEVEEMLEMLDALAYELGDGYAAGGQNYMYRILEKWRKLKQEGKR